MADLRRDMNVAGGLWQTQIGAPDKSIDESEKAKVVAGLWRKQIGSAQGAGGAGVPMPQPIALQFANPQAPVPPAGRVGKGVGGVGVGTGTVLDGAGGGQPLWPSMPLSTLGGAELVYPGAGGIGGGGVGLGTGIGSVPRGTVMPSERADDHGSRPGPTLSARFIPARPEAMPAAAAATRQDGTFAHAGSAAPRADVGLDRLRYPTTGVPFGVGGTRAWPAARANLSAVALGGILAQMFQGGRPAGTVFAGDVIIPHDTRGSVVRFLRIPPGDDTGCWPVEEYLLLKRNTVTIVEPDSVQWTTKPKAPSTDPNEPDAPDFQPYTFDGREGERQEWLVTEYLICPPAWIEMGRRTIVVYVGDAVEQRLDYGRPQDLDMVLHLSELWRGRMMKELLTSSLLVGSPSKWPVQR